MIGVLIYFIVTATLFMVLYSKNKIKIQCIFGYTFKGRYRKYGVDVYKQDRQKMAEQKYRAFPIMFMSLYQTKFGIRFVDNLIRNHRKFKRFLKHFGYVLIGVCVVIIVATLYSFIKLIWLKFGTVNAPAVQQGVMLILPFKIKGQMYVPFFYWLIAIFVVMIVHEFGHAVYARLNNVPIKSTGLAFIHLIIPLLPAAFVEPDEKILQTKDKKKQLSIFAAGPSFNIIFGILILSVWMILIPFARQTRVYNGVKITDIENPDITGLTEGMIISSVDNYPITNTEDFAMTLSFFKPNDKINLCSASQCYPVILQPNTKMPDKVYLGIYAVDSIVIRPEILNKYGRILPGLFINFMTLLMWLMIFNIGIGMFNILPIGPLDGGRMLHVSIKDIMYGDTIFLIITFAFIGLIILSMI